MPSGGSFKAGDAYIEVNPSLEGWQEKLRADIDARTTRAQVPVEPVLDDPAVAELRARLEAALEHARASIDTTEADAQIAELAAELKAAIEQALARQTLGVDTAAAEAKIAEIGAALDAAVRDREVKLNHAAATAEVRVLQAEIDRAVSTPRELHVSTARAEADIAAMQAGGLAPTLPEELHSANIIPIIADTAEVTPAVEEARAEIESLPAEHTTRIRVDTADLDEAATKFGLLGTMASGLVSTLVPMGAALTGVLGASLTLFPGAIVGAVALKEGFTGVHQALTAWSTMNDQAAASVGQLADKQQQAAEQITAAQDRVTNAERGVANARDNAASGAVNAAERVKSAQDGVVAAQEAAATSIASALDRQAQAEASLESAQASEQRAQENLTEARATAAEQLEQLNFSTQDNALAQRHAALTLTKALATQSKDAAPAGSYQSQVDQLAVDEAQQRITELAHKGTDLAAQKAQADRTGVDGTKVVQSAQDQLTAAIGRTAAAHREVEKAATAVNTAQEQGAIRVQKAQEAVQTALRAQSDQARTSANAIATAQAGVVTAQTALEKAQDAATKATQGGEAAANAYAIAMSKLGPAGQEFVKYLETLSGPSGPLAKLRSTAEAGLLPGVENLIKGIIGDFPQINALIGVTATQFGILATRVGDALGGPIWQQWLDYMTRIAPYAISTFGTLVGNTFGGFAGLAKGFEPILVQLGGGLEKLTERWRNFGTSAAGGGNTGFNAFLDYVYKSGPVVAAFFGQLFTLIGHISQGLAGAGFSTLSVLVDTLRMLNSLDPMILGLATQFFLSMRFLGASGLGGLLGGLGGRLTGVATAAGAAATSLSGSARAGAAVEGSMTRAGSALSAFGKALPFIGIAVIAADQLIAHFTASTDDAVAAMGRGGQSAQDMAAKVAGQTATVNGNATGLQRWVAATDNWISSQVFGIATTDSVTESYKKQRDAMTPLQRAQADLTQATGDYTQKLHDLGAGAPQTVAALGKMQDAQAEVTRVTGATEKATEDYRGALVRLQLQIAGTLDADVALQSAQVAITKATQDAAAAVRDHGKGSAEDKAAQLSLEQALLQGMAAAKQKAEADYQGTDAAEKAKLGSEAYNKALLINATSQNTTVREAALGMIAKLNDTETAALNTTAKTDGFRLAIENLPPGKKVEVSAPGLDTTRTAMQGLHQDILNIKGLDVPIFVSPLGSGGIASAARLASGGPVQGPGSGTSDSVPAWLSHGEHVLTAAEVAAAGGHGAVYALRQALLGGAGFAAGMMAGAPRFADGGAVDTIKINLPTTDSFGWIGQLHKTIADFLAAQTSGGDLVAWARTQVGKPYVWGGVGPSGYDCSGFVSALVNYVRGQPLFHRVGSTANFPWPGFLPGTGDGLNVGSTLNAGGGIGHMAATVNGINLESNGSQGVVVGGPTGALSKLFNIRAHLPMPASMLASAGGGGMPSGNLAGWIAAAERWTGVPGTWTGPLNTLIMRESGGNPNAINRTDSNARAGHPSQGLMQTIPSTFEAYRDRRLPDIITDPVANIAAGINYIKARYGSIFSVQQANANMPPKGYDAGGWLPPGVHTVVNGTGAPERILTAAQTAAFDRLVGAAERGRGGAGDTFHITPPPTWDYVRMAHEITRVQDVHARTH